MTLRTIAKFYSNVSLSRQDDAHVVLLDGKPVRTPGRAMLSLPSRALAEAVAEEWRGQGEKIDPATMPLTGITNTAIDRLPIHRDAVVSHIANFGRSDLLCYRAEAPSELSSRQSEAWDPLLAWVAATHGADLLIGTGVAFVVQPREALVALERTVRSRDDFTLAGLNTAASLTGSLVLVLALADGRLNAERAFAAAVVDEAYQAENWGIDEAAEARRARLLAELAAVERFLRLLAT